jgi:hypothetical protein
MTFHKRAFDFFDIIQNCATMNCQRNVNSTLPTQLPHKFSYIVAIHGHNHFESPNTSTPLRKKNDRLTLYGDTQRRDFRPLEDKRLLSTIV